MHSYKKSELKDLSRERLIDLVAGLQEQVRRKDELIHKLQQQTTKKGDKQK